MTSSWVLVDGYSVLHFWRKLLPAARGRAAVKSGRRDQLIRVLQQFADARGCRMTVVFDGYGARHHPESSGAGPGIDVLYSPEGKTADDVIERLVADSGDPSSVLVVTSDNLERQTVESLGATSMSAEMFEEETILALEQLGLLVRQHSRRTKGWPGR